MAGNPAKQGNPSPVQATTRSGWPIPCEQAVPPDRRHREASRAMELKHKHWQRRKQPCGVYNCFGMVLLNRRASIYGTDTMLCDDVILKVLSDDGYRPLGPDETPVAGDIVIYRYNTTTILHAGLVINVKPPSGLALREVWVLSKWNDSLGEHFHLDSDHPLGSDTLKEYMTDREKPQGQKP